MPGYTARATAAQSLLGAGAATHLALMAREGGWLSRGVNASVVLFCAVSLLVYAVAAARIHRGRGVASWRGLVLALGLASAGPGIAAYGIFVSGGDQRGLVFLFLPPLQWLLYAVLALLI